MAIHVKDQRTDALVREFAELRGIGITDAIRQAVEEALSVERAAAKAPIEALKRRLQPLFDEVDAYPSTDRTIDKASFDEMWGDGDVSR
ncbi:type II toxin-antitoxin system VapB family antitoxin [Mesorhizobium sp. CAU 1732]|uniref:type II toxin-antitoxin system VapB family antitoxin n=1 Tax=Mesorhizobium sp. CAU 1732 TaxID=3140358 RepID=UPI0032605719